MKPIKTKDLLPEVAHELGLSLDKVEAVSSFYWAEARKALQDPSSIRVHIANLGDFTVKHWVVQEKIKRYRKMIQAIENKGRGNTQIAQAVRDRLAKYQELLEAHKAELQRKEFIKQHKKVKQENHVKTTPDLA